MLKQLKNNNDGVVLIIVLVIVMTMMVLVLSVISMQTSSVSIAEEEIKQIQAEILGRGILAYVVANKYAGGSSNYFDFSSISLGHIDFNVTANILPTNSLIIDITY